MIRPGWRWLLRPLMALVVLALSWLAVEAAARTWLWLNPPTGHIGRWEFRGARPLPYAHSDYFSTEFLDESMRCVRLSNPPDTNYVVHDEFHGTHINIENLCRRTTDQPANPDHRLLLFGGSTIFCQEVPDSLTVTSYLQRELNRSGPRYRVENHGTVAMIAAQETERLKHTPINPGDVVLFYDGVNDVNQPVYKGNPKGFMLGDANDGGVRKLTGAQAILYPVTFRMKDYSAVAKVLFHRMDGPRPANIVDADTLARNLDAAEHGYYQALTEARAIAESHGARFVHVFQPQLFSVTQPSAYERNVARNELKLLPGLDEAYRVGYPRLRQALARARSEGMESHDLSSILDARTDGEEFYFDFCHVNEVANERLATAIAATVFGHTSVK